MVTGVDTSPRAGVGSTRTVTATFAHDPPDAITGAASFIGQRVATVAGAVDPNGAGETVEGVAVSEHLYAFADAACDVVVDFTVADAARNTLPWLGMHGIHAVVGTTGFTDADFELFESTFASASGPNCVIAPNFAISAVLMMRFAEMAAPFFDTAEII